MKAFVQVATNGNEAKLYEELKNFEEVKEVHMLFGEWDFLALVEIENAEQLAAFVVDKIRSLPNVRLTSTMICAK
ncbi:Lrp/AsnC family transcriptional regulator [Candidatus Woesearchaeota archaeon]|nr:MAG: Lrp/AsnC family transcriptional regulator [Candidatus Woesearchaeota archaeon]